MAAVGLLRVGGHGEALPGHAAPAHALRPQEQAAAGGLLGAEAKDHDNGGGGQLNIL